MRANECDEGGGLTVARVRNLMQRPCVISFRGDKRPDSADSVGA